MLISGKYLLKEGNNKMATISITKKIVGWKIPGKEDVITKTNDNRPLDIIYTSAPKRPERLECDIHFPTYKGRKWVVIVGLYKGKPYEVFTGFSENIQIPSKCSKGFVVKYKNTYNLEIDLGADEPLVIKDIVKVFNNPETAWATRILSSSLRHGTPPFVLAEQLNKDGFVNDYNKAISRCLKKYILDNTTFSDKVCEKCGGTQFIYEMGCAKCISCNDSKCG